MILQLNPPIPIFSVPHQEKGYAHVILEYGLENYFYFIFSLDKTGEVWILPNTDIRFTTNIAAKRSSINKEPFSKYLQKGSSTIKPYIQEEP